MASVTKPVKRKCSPDERQENDGVQFIPKRIELEPLKDDSIYYFRNGQLVLPRTHVISCLSRSEARDPLLF